MAVKHQGGDGSHQGYGPRLFFWLLAGLAASLPLVAPSAVVAQGGFGVRLDAPGYRLSDKVLEIPAGQPASGALLLHNLESKPLPARLLCLVDYRQEAFSFDGSESDAFNLLVQPGDPQPRPIVIGPFSPGMHEVSLLFFMVPALHLPDPEFRADTPFLFQGYRFRVVAGVQASRTPDFIRQGEPDPSSGEAEHIFRLEQGGEGRHGDWLTDDGGTREYVVRFNNIAAGEPMDFALLAFMDYRQVDIRQDLPVARIRVPPASRTTVTGSLPAADGEGPHEFAVVLVENPYGDLAPREGRDIRSSHRVLIQSR